MNDKIPLLSSELVVEFKIKRKKHFATVNVDVYDDEYNALEDLNARDLKRLERHEIGNFIIVVRASYLGFKGLDVLGGVMLSTDNKGPVEAKDIISDNLMIENAIVDLKSLIQANVDILQESGLVKSLI